MNEDFQKIKSVKRIVTYAEIYKNDFDELMKLDLEKLKKLEQVLFIGLRIKVTYRNRQKLK